MIGYSLLLPQRNGAEALRRQLPGVEAALEDLPGDYELVCVDDGSHEQALEGLRQLQTEHPRLRLLRLDGAWGLSAALSVGVQAARGETVLAMAVGQEYRAEQIPRLLSGLARADFVQGKRRRRGLPKLWERVARLPRWLLIGLEVRDPECLFWAARREALVGLDLPRGMYRYLAPLVATRGYRVNQMLVDAGPAEHHAQESRPNPLDLLAIWWHRRRYRPYHAYEITTSGAAQRILSFPAASVASATAAPRKKIA